MLGHAPGWGFWDRGTTGTELALSQVKIRKGKRRKKNRGRERRGEEEEDKKKRKKRPVSIEVSRELLDRSNSNSSLGPGV